MSDVKLRIDDTEVSVPAESTILDAAKKARVKIPTLCHLEGVQAIGACRVCLVEVEGARTLLPSCVTPVREGMQVWTRTRRVRNARRTVVELLLSDHDGDCQTCERNDDCELQALARELGIRELRYTGETSRRIVDRSTPALVRDTAKCILCRRCVAACCEVQGVGALFPQGRGFSSVIGPAFCADLDSVACVQCGQCAAVCPVGAISELDQIDEVWSLLDDPEKHVVVQTAPAIRAALGECFGYPPGTLVTGKMVAALRRLGFDAVFDTNFAADLTIMEEGSELLARLKKALVDEQKVALPQFTSCSPGWIKYAEYFYPDLLANISTCKSPQQMFGAVAKTYYADKLGKRPEDIAVVSIMPCTAKKFEAQRAEMNDSGVRDVDVVLTTRELGRMIRQSGVDFRSLPDEEMDAPLGLSTGAADIFANTGGVMEAALRTVYEIVTGRPLPFDNLHIEPIAGLEGVKEAALTLESCKPEWSFLEGVEVKVAVAHGLTNARKILDKVRAGESDHHFIEIMTCPGGCIGGGGQPRMTDDAVRAARIKAIYLEDEGKKLRKSHENPDLQKLYADFLGEPLGEKSHKLLHTHYEERARV
ncbi:MAG: iron hydrogenase small subunit [Deltaproteobacteria bacterium]|nr:iron hydrogenase small subunit [Deltaproteobacteria bacterium]